MPFQGTSRTKVLITEKPFSLELQSKTYELETVTDIVDMQPYFTIHNVQIGV